MYARHLMSFSLAALALVLGPACTDEPEVTPTPEDTFTPTPEEDSPTEVVGVITPTPTPTPEPNPLSGIQVWPESFHLDLSSTLTYTVRGYMRTGEEVTFEDGSLLWASSDEAVATVDTAGRVTPVGVGLTYVTASSGEVVSPPVELEVMANGLMTVTVVDADSRLPLPDVRVYRGLDGSDVQTSDADGVVHFSGDFSGVQILTGSHLDYHYATLYEVTEREVVLPMRAKATTRTGRFCGESDFSGMDKLGSNEIRVGLITRSFFGNPLTLDTSTIIGAFRKVTVCGATTSIPSNVVGELPSYCQRTGARQEPTSRRLLREAAEDDPPPTCPSLAYELLKYAVPGPTGMYDSYMLAGDLVAQDVISWVTDPEIFTNLGKLLLGISNMYEFSYEYAQDIPITAPYDTVDIPLAPDGRTNQALSVKVPAMPSGVNAEYPPVVFAIADMGERGFMPVGIAGANPSSTVPVFLAEEFTPRPLYGLVMASEGGVGNDGAYVAVMGQSAGGKAAVETPPFMPLIQPDKLHSSLADRSFRFYPVDDATVYRTTFTWRYTLNGVYTEDYWDVYQPTDRVQVLEETTGDGSTLTTKYVEVILPSLTEAYPLDSTRKFDWEFLGYDNGLENFHTLTSSSERNIYDSALDLQRITRNKIYDTKVNL